MARRNSPLRKSSWPTRNNGNYFSFSPADRKNLAAGSLCTSAAKSDEERWWKITLNLPPALRFVVQSGGGRDSGFAVGEGAVEEAHEGKLRQRFLFLFAFGFGMRVFGADFI